jgi:hypothetical protein
MNFKEEYFRFPLRIKHGIRTKTNRLFMPKISTIMSIAAIYSFGSQKSPAFLWINFVVSAR